MRRWWILLTLLSLMPSSQLHAAAGKWTPEQLLEHDPEWLEELGLDLSVSELWKAEGGGLLEAIVRVGGCSAGLVSADGLVVTNHHCVFSMLQEHSTPERDLIAEYILEPYVEPIVQWFQRTFLGIDAVRTGPETLLDQVAVAQADFDAHGDEYSGRVRVNGEVWTAHASTACAAGAKLRIVGRDGLVLRVEEPESGTPRSGSTAQSVFRHLN